MSDISSSAQNKADDLGGKVKDAVGVLTDDTSLQAEGNVDQATADAKQAVAVRCRPARRRRYRRSVVRHLNRC